MADERSGAERRQRSVELAVEHFRSSSGIQAKVLLELAKQIDGWIKDGSVPQ